MSIFFFAVAVANAMFAAISLYSLVMETSELSVRTESFGSAFLTAGCGLMNLIWRTLRDCKFLCLRTKH